MENRKNQMELPTKIKQGELYESLECNSQSGITYTISRPRKSDKWCLFICSLITSLICLAAFIMFWKLSRVGLVPPNPEVALPPSPSKLHEFSKAAVCTDGPPCSQIGRDILKQSGNAVDAAIAALFCNGVVNSQAMGLGGGFLMTIYNRTTGKAISLNARDAAPRAANKDMFMDKNKREASRTGGLAIGVPGELKGYWTAWKRFGKLAWKEIVKPAIELCERGYNMSKPQYDVLSFRPNIIENDPIFREMFIDSKTKTFRRYGEVIKPTIICKTLKIIADEGGDALHAGSLTDLFVEDIKQLGGLITKDDLNNYKAEWVEPVFTKLRDGNTVYSSPPPGSGALLTFILKVLDGYNLNKDNFTEIQNSITSTHRIIEAFKFAFALRTELGDPRYVNISELIRNLTSPKYAETIRNKIDVLKTYRDPNHYGAVYYKDSDHGTAHISVLSEEGDAVSVTSTINLYFGAGVTSRQTGIILNSVMDDFSVPGLINYFGLPPSPNNFIEPGKKPLSSASPSIIIDKNGDVRLVIGASGGTKIPTAVAWVIIRHLWLNENVKQAVDESRIHHQLVPMKIAYEYGIIEPIIQGLRKLGHETERYRDRGSVICAVSQNNGTILANADYRKGGEVYGY